MVLFPVEPGTGPSIRLGVCTLIKIVMTREIEEKLHELHEVLKLYMPKETTSVNIFINCKELRFETSQRLPEQLKSQGVSMKNIAGDWIC